MLKAVCMFKLKDDISEKDFEEYFKKHIDDAKNLINLKKYTISKSIKSEDKIKFYRINELYYNSMEELEESFSSDLGKFASEDLSKWVDDFQCIIVEEEIVLPERV